MEHKIYLKDIRKKICYLLVSNSCEVWKWIFIKPNKRAIIIIFITSICFYSSLTAQNYHYVLNVPNENQNLGTSFRGYTAVSQETDPSQIRLMKDDNSNVVRWMLYRTWTKDNRQNISSYQEWLDAELIKLDAVMTEAEKYGIKVVLDLHTPPGEFYGDGSQRLFYEQKYLDYYVKVWKQISKRYNGHPALFAYELLNEPVELYKADLLKNHIEAQSMAARAIRSIDENTPLIFSSNAWNAPNPFFTQPVTEFKNVIYSVHFYELMEYTHQGIPGFSPERTSYNENEGQWWQPFDKTVLQQRLKRVRDFQKEHNIEIFVGEFSVVRWAENADQWLEDVIEIFEEYGWDWVYHSWCNYRTNIYSSTFWSLEAANGDFGKQTTTIAQGKTTDRKKVILKGFSRNYKN